MPTPIMYPTNVLEGGIFTLSPDGAVAGKGAERLDDRDIGLECEDSGNSGTRTWHCDRGVGAPSDSVDTFIIDGSSYSGETIVLQTSPDNAAWTTQLTEVIPADGPQAFPLDTSSLSCPRYVRWTIASPSSPVIFTEVFLTLGIELIDKPNAPRHREPQIPNVVTIPSASGRSWGVQRGARRWSAIYAYTHSPDADRETLLDVLDSIADGALPFWLVNHRGELIWVRMPGSLDLQAAELKPKTWVVDLTMVEELP